MLKTIKIKIKHWIKRWLDVYDIEDLQTGANCGICGKWISDVIAPKLWTWCLCDSCENVNDVDMKKLRQKMNQE